MTSPGAPHAGARPSTERVERRQVFFFSGFDPKGAAYYHRLYQEGAQAQQAARGDRYRVGPRERTDERLAQRWQVECRPAGAVSDDPVFTDFEFLAWDDLVRAQWPKGILGVAIGSVLAYIAAISSGTALVRVWRQTPRTLVALAYPAIFWLLALLGGLALGGALAGLLARAGAPAAVQGVAAVASALALWGAALAIERRLHTSWLLRIYRFADHWARGRLPDLEQRLDAMADRVWRSLQTDDSDEVLLVGYSVGSMLAVSVLARVLQRYERTGDAQAALRAQQRLSLLTLGQCVPLLGLMPRAEAFRGELAVLARATAVRWTDFSAPGDWGSFALVDPLRICRVAPTEAPVLVPQMRSPRFHTLFPADDYALLRRNKRRLHLQYLMAAPLAGDYDYFLLTAGPERLGGPQPQTPSP